MPPVRQSVSFTFFDPSGAPLAGGKVTARLSTDLSASVVSGPQVAATEVSAVLDSGGSATLSLWPNRLLLPADSVYFINAFSAQGQPVWSGQTTVG